MSDRGSVRSGHSGNSRGYRRVGSGVQVDESLFASKHQHSVSRLRQQREKQMGKKKGDRSIESKSQEVVIF